MNTQKTRNTAAGMVRDALMKIVEWDKVQDLRSFADTEEEATRLLDFAEAALSYFSAHYDFPQEEAHRKLDEVRLVLNDEDLCAEAMLSEIGCIVGEESEVTK